MLHCRIKNRNKFFTIDRRIYISLLIMLIMAVVVGSIVNICGQSSNRLHRYTSRYKLKRLYKKTGIRDIHIY